MLGVLHIKWIMESELVFCRLVYAETQLLRCWNDQSLKKGVLWFRLTMITDCNVSKLMEKGFLAEVVSLYGDIHHNYLNWPSRSLNEVGTSFSAILWVCWRPWSAVEGFWEVVCSFLTSWVAKSLRACWLPIFFIGAQNDLELQSIVFIFLKKVVILYFNLI